jgi:sugar/nucleoside kinase (ribokinase family)
MGVLEDRMASRAEIAAAAAMALDAIAARGQFKPALVGFDGFIDAITEAVDTRADMTPRGYARMRTITQFAARAAAAAGKSTNIELVVTEERFGGNGPLMAGAQGRVGVPVTYVGGVGQHGEYGTKLHPVFEPFAARCRAVFPICPPAHTDALEFDDGKIMFNRPANAQAVTWERIAQVLGLERLVALVDEAALLGIVNWSLLGGVEGIWRGLMRDVLPRVRDAKSKRVYIDLSDPAKRTDEDIRRAMGLLAELNGDVPVTLGLNLSEAERMARVFGVVLAHQTGEAGFQPAPKSASMTSDSSQQARAEEDGCGLKARPPALTVFVPALAEALRAAMHLDTIVIHPREGAAAASPHARAWFDGPFTATPRLSTGAGDHFNAGFALAQVHGLPIEQCLAVGCAVSGAYVRDAVSPDFTRLVGFLRELPVTET